MLKRLLFGLLALVAAFLIVVWMQPDDYRLTRSTTIMAPAAEIFARVNDLRRWEDWSPWAKLDPNAKVSFEGPPAGPGAMFHWSGNDKVGAGTMTITASKPNERVATRTDFMKPFEGTNDSEFVFSGRADQTDVIWTMTGRHNFIGKAMCLVMSMEKMLGPDFERGLMQLKMASERK
jgi:Polyketide cyclase / dehydrase and lipid transport